MDEKVSDEELMNRYRGGQTQAFEILYARHKGPLFRYLSRQCHTPAVAEELFQDVWVKLIRARERYEVRAKFTTYLYHLAHNRLIDYYRRVQAAVPVVADEESNEALIEQVADHAQHQPDNELDRRRLGKRLLALIAALPDVQREVFLLREEGGLSLEDIAAVTGVNLETAKSRLRYALHKLRQGLYGERT